MLIKILRTGVEKHCDRDLADTLIQSGLAEAVIRDGGAKPQPAAQCELRWTLGATTDEKTSILRYHCDACKISGGGLGQQGAQQIAVWHRGKKETPPAELVKKAHGHLNSLLGSASMISMQPGYEGSTTPWTITIADQEAAKVGKSADDRPKDFNVVSLGSINGV